MKFYDNHTHSHFSPDSRMTLQQSLAAAAQAGIAGISITDHLDIDAPDGKDIFVFNPEQHQREIDLLAPSFPSLEIFKGIEVGLQIECMDKIKDFTGKFDFDIVIASTHFIDNVDPYFGEYYIGKNHKEAYGHAYEVMYRAIVDYNDFDVLGHFDYIARYAPYEVRDIKYSQFADELDSILRFLAQEGKALEINTNTYRERNGHTPQLDIEILKRFKELGGEAVSFGSDAHEAWRIAENFEQYRQVVKNCGFNYLVYYKNRQPHFYSI